MKLKTINNVIRNKMKEWLASLPNDLAKEVKSNLIVTGGAIASLLLKEPVNDYDLYFQDRGVLEKLVRYYLSTVNSGAVIKDVDFYSDQPNPMPDEEKKERLRIFIQSDGVCKFKVDTEKKYMVVYITENALTLSDKIQIVTRFIGDPEKIHSNYDYQHVTNYWTFNEGLVTNKKALESLITKELMYMGSKYPLCSIIRTRKFIKRGWTVNAGQYLKMAFQLNDLDLTDINVLRDQLIGVDSAYFNFFIECLEKKKEDETFDLTDTYLCNLVDFIFNKDFSGDDESEDREA